MSDTSNGPRSRAPVAVAVLLLVMASALVGAAVGANMTDQNVESPQQPQPNVTKVVMEDSAVASFVQRGPDGTVEFEKRPDGDWNIHVRVTEWNDYEMLLVYAFKDPYSEKRYLHPGDNTTTIKGVPEGGFVDLHIPVKDRYQLGYVWEKEYWLDNSVGPNDTDSFESNVRITAVDQEYTTKAENETTDD